MVGQHCSIVACGISGIVTHLFRDGHIASIGNSYSTSGPAAMYLDMHHLHHGGQLR
jgi:hypothetical protein